MWSFDKSYRNKINFRIKVVLLVLAATIFPFVTSVYYINTTAYGILENNLKNELLFSFKQTTSTINLHFSFVNNISMQLLTNKEIKAALIEAASYPDLHAASVITNTIHNQIDSTWMYSSGTYKLLNSILIYADDSHYYFQTRGILNNADYVKIQLDNIVENKRIPYFQAIPEYHGILIYYDIMDEYNPQKKIGSLVLGVDTKFLQEMYGAVSNYNGHFFSISKDDTPVLMSSGTDLPGNPMPEEYARFQSYSPFSMADNCFINYTPLSYYNLNSLIVIPTESVLAGLSKSAYKYYVSLIFMSVVFLLLSLVLFTNILRPIHTIVKKIDAVHKDNFDVKMPNFKDADFNRIGTAFNDMTDRIQMLIQQVYKKEILLKDAELKSLQSQINPHFIFNVLETINWEARSSGNERICEMTGNLGTLIRANINNNSREKLHIFEEIDYVRRYLSLQKIRFGDRLQVHFFIENRELENCFIPKLVIQTVVENSIIHGIEGKQNDAYLGISVNECGNDIEISVTDNGVGFNTSVIDLNKSSSGRNSIGLYNCHQRIRIMYGEQYGLSIQSAVGSGTNVIINLPKDRGDILV